MAKPQYAVMCFQEKHQSMETIISAVVHVDKKTPHKYLSFVPLADFEKLRRNVERYAPKILKQTHISDQNKNYER